MEHFRIFIGIDPDIEKSGFAVWNGTKFTHLTALPTPELLKTMDSVGFNWAVESGNFLDIRVRIDAGWLNEKSNYHTAQGARIREKIAKNVGENFGVGKTIAAILSSQGWQVELVKPTKSKFSYEQFMKITNNQYKDNFKKLMTYKQEIVDAAMMCYGL